MSFNKDIIPHIAVTQGSDDEETEFLTLNEYATDVEDLEEDSVKVPRKEILKIKLNKGDYVTDQEDVEGSDENHELEFKADVDIDKHFQEIEVGEEVSEVYQEKGKKSLKKQQSMTTRSGSLTSKLTVEGNDTDEEEFDTDNEMQVKETPDSNVNIIAYNVATSMKEASFEADKKPSGLRVENQSGYLSAYSVSPNLSDFTDIEIIHSDAEEDEQVKKTNTKVKRKKRKSFHGRYNTDDEDVELSDDEIKTETKKPHRPKTVTKSKSVSLNYSSDNEDNYPVFPICKKVAEKNHILNVPEFNTNCPTDVEDFMSPTDEYVPFKSESLSDPEVEKKVNEATESQIVTSVKSVEKKLKTKSQGSVEDEDNDLDVIDLTDFKISNKSQRYAEREEYTSKSMHVSTDEEEFDEEVIIGSEVYQDLPLPNPTRNITIFSEKGTFSTVTILPLDKNETEPENTEFSAPETDEESVSEADEVADLKTPTNIPNMDWEVTTIQENSVDKTNFDILEIDENSPKIQRRRKPPKFKHLYEKQVNRQNRLRAEEQKKYEEKSDIEEVVILDDEEPDKPKESSKDKQNISFHEEDITSTDEESISPSNAKTTARNQKKRQANGAKIPLSPSQEVMYLKGGYFPEMQGTNWSTYFWLPNPVSANEKNSRDEQEVSTSRSDVPSQSIKAEGEEGTSEVEECKPPPPDQE